MRAYRDLSLAPLASTRGPREGGLVFERVGRDGVRRTTEITLRPKLVIANSRDAERASRILEKAERNCLISNSVKAEIWLEAEVSSQTA